MRLTGLLLLDPTEPPAPGWVDVEGGRITAVEEGAPAGATRRADRPVLICPGFIDAHVHLPQVDSAGCDGMELLAWLERVIYPAEMRWEDPALARRQAARAVRRMLAAGTLGYAGYLTSHPHAVAAAIEAGRELPLRAEAGQVLMDREAPAPLLGHPVAPLARGEDERFAATANPRFAVTCTAALLDRARALAGGGALIQTHLAESPAEVRRVTDLFPDDEHYAGVYDRHGLLTPRTLLAHCVHLREEEWRLIATRGAVVVHCPAANTFLRSGLFDLDAARRHGIRLALGSDVAAGCDLDMPRAARAMIEVAKHRSLLVGGAGPVPTPADAWSLITRGNADALGWPDAGRLEVGAAADLLVLEPPFEIDEHLVGRLIHTWSREYITRRILAGSEVGSL